MTRTLTLKSCHLWGIVWFGIIGALIFPLILNISNVVTIHKDSSMFSSMQCFTDFFDHYQAYCNDGIILPLYFFLVVNIVLIGVTVWYGLYWLNGHYKWVTLDIRSCWTE